LIREWRFREAVDLLEQTAAGLSAFAPGEARAQLERALADVRLAQRLDAIRLGRPARARGRRDATTAPAYRAAFAEYGLNCDGDPAALGERLAGSPIRDALVAALDDWALEEPDAGRQMQLIRAARAVDPNPWKKQFWEALVRRDVPALRALADRADVNQLAPAALTQLLWWVGVDTPEGEGLARRAQARHPGDFWLNLALATLFYRQADRADKDREALMRTIENYRACVALRPTAGPIFINLGTALYHRGDAADAETAYLRALEIDPGLSLAHTGLGYVLLRRSDSAGARAAFERAITLSPNDPDAHGDLGSCLLARGDLKGAIRAFEKRSALAPRSALARSDLGNVLRQAGDLPRAEAACLQALGLDPTFASAHYNLGLVKWNQGNGLEALVAFSRALELDPKLALAHNSMGAIWSSRGETTTAVTCFRRAIELDPTYAPAHYNLGNALSVQGDLIGALAAYRWAVARDPKLDVGYLALIRTLLNLGRFTEARAIALRVLGLFPSGTPDHDVVLRLLHRSDLMIRLDRQLPAVLLGTVHPASRTEHLAFADLAATRRWYAASARLYEELHRKSPLAANGGAALWRYNAACSAALAGCGQGIDDPAPTTAERTRWRGQALAWLRADLTGHAAQLAGAGSERQRVVRQVLSHWRTDRDLAGVREAAELAKLTVDERHDWERFWAEIDLLLAPTGR
jgi:tetratricopeptide (TPR) repeat protein